MRGRPRPPKLRSGRSKGGHANKPEFLSRKEQGVGALGSRFSVCQLTRFVYEEEEAEPDPRGSSPSKRWCKHLCQGSEKGKARRGGSQLWEGRERIFHPRRTNPRSYINSNTSKGKHSYSGRELLLFVPKDVEHDDR